MEFSRQEDWSGLPFPPPRDFLKLGSSVLQADFLPFEPQGRPSGHAIWHGQKKMDSWVLHLQVQRADCTISFYMRDLSIVPFGYLQRVLNQSPEDAKGPLCTNV